MKPQKYWGFCIFRAVQAGPIESKTGVIRCTKYSKAEQRLHKRFGMQKPQEIWGFVVSRWCQMDLDEHETTGVRPKNDRVQFLAAARPTSFGSTIGSTTEPERSLPSWAIRTSKPPGRASKPQCQALLPAPAPETIRRKRERLLNT